MIVLAELQPYDPVTATRRTLRAASANNPAVTGLNDLRWAPAIAGRLPALGIRLFSGDFDGNAAPTAGTLSLQIDRFVTMGIDPDVRRYNWAAAPIKLWAGAIGQAWPWTQVAELKVKSFTASGNTVDLSLGTNDEPFAADVLTLKYAGTGGIEGPTDLKGKPKPFLLGRCSNVEPVLIDAVNNVYQVSGYGTIEAVTKLYERGSEFPASSGDYASYAALIAAAVPADIPNGGWATCLASGLIRLAAPQFGVITADVDGDKAGGTWRRKTGEIILRLLDNAGVSSGLIESTSFTGLDTALAGLDNEGRIGVYLTTQASVADVAARLAAPCNAQAGVSLMGKLFASRIAPGTPSLTFDAQQRQQPRVTGSSEQSVSPPFSFMEMGYDRSWRVHTEDEIALIGGGDTPRIEAPSGRNFSANYTGTLDPSDQLPATFAFKRFRGETDVTATTAWTLDSQTGISGGTVTVGAATGVATIPSGCSIALTASIRVKASRDGLDMFASVALTRTDGPPPSGGGGGGTTVNDSTFVNVSTTSKVDISDEMTVKTGASGVITFSGTLAIIAAAASPASSTAFGSIARWQWKTVGGSYADVGGSDFADDYPAVVYFDAEFGSYESFDGLITVATSITGLAANTDHVVKLQAARDTSSPTKTLGFGGTVYAVGS